MYELLSGFLIKQGFNRGKVDTTLFITWKVKHIILFQIYVNDIIFGSTNESHCQEFTSLMQRELEMSLMGELIYFLGLQIKQDKEVNFISQMSIAWNFHKSNDW